MTIKPYWFRSFVPRGCSMVSWLLHVDTSDFWWLHSSDSSSLQGYKYLYYWKKVAVVIAAVNFMTNYFVLYAGCIGQKSFHSHRYRNCYFAAASVFETDVSAPPISKKPPTIPPLASTPPLRVLLIVEPTPFTYISGYANRFKVIHSSFNLYYMCVFIHACIMLT